MHAKSGKLFGREAAAVVENSIRKTAKLATHKDGSRNGKEKGVSTVQRVAAADRGGDVWRTKRERPGGGAGNGRTASIKPEGTGCRMGSGRRRGSYSTVEKGKGGKPVEVRDLRSLHERKKGCANAKAGRGEGEGTSGQEPHLNAVTR